MYYLFTIIQYISRISGKSSPKSKQLLSSTVYYKMLRNNLSQILSIVLSISCVVHVMFIFYNNSYPAIPEILIETKKIMDVNMPLSFIFCLRNTNTALENEKYRKTGYENIQRFFSGTSMYNESVIGWLGHVKNGAAFDSLEGI